MPKETWALFENTTVPALTELPTAEIAGPPPPPGAATDNDICNPLVFRVREPEILAPLKVVPVLLKYWVTVGTV